MADAFIGEVRAFAFKFAPAGWAFCDGRAVSVQQYQALYAVIGTLYGSSGNPPTTFNLPDLRGRAPMHRGSYQTMTGTIAQTMGVPAVTLSVAQMPVHTHQGKGLGVATGGTASGTPSATAYISTPKIGNAGYDAWTTTSPTTTMNAASISAVGGTSGATQAHSNLSPYLALNFCICLEGGEFPMRN